MATNDLQALLADGPGFVAVVEHGGFAAAARRLGVAPSVLSRRVSRLERTLSVRLLERNTRALRPTDEGAAVFEHLRRVLEVAEETLALADEGLAEPRGTVRIGAPRELAAEVVHPLLMSFLDRHPDVAVEFAVTDRPIEPIADGLDLMFSITREPVEGLVGRRLRRVRQTLCASPTYLERRGEPDAPEALTRHDCLRLDGGPRQSTWRLRRDGVTTAVTVAGRYSANHAGSRLDAAVRGLGICSVPDFTATAALADGSLREVLPDWEALGSFEGFVQLQYPASPLLPRRTRAVIDHVVEALRD